MASRRHPDGRRDGGGHRPRLPRRAGGRDRFRGPSDGELRRRTIRLRASYSPAYKKATLAHEIGHRLAFTLPRNSGLDDHRLLYLFLYDVWADLYGRDFADRMVSIERRIGPSYAEAWAWALAMTREDRQARLRALRSQAAPGQTRN